MKFILIIMAFIMPLFGQQANGLSVVVNDGPGIEDWTTLAFYNSNNTYLCQAKKDNAQTTITQSAISNANPGVVTATAHGIPSIASPTVTISGGTGNWAAINGTWKVTYIDANSFSIPVDTTSFGAVSGTVVITTKAPLSNKFIWRVQKIAGDGTNYLGTLTAVGGYSNKCSDYLTLSYQ